MICWYHLSSKIISLDTRNHIKQNPEKLSIIKAFRDFNIKFTLYL